MTPTGATGGRFKTAFAFAVAAVAVTLVFWLSRALLFAFCGLLLAIVLDSMAGLAIRFLGMRRWVAVVLATLVFLAAVGASVALIAIPITREATRLVQTAPQKLAQVEHWIEQQREQFPWLNRLISGQQAG